MRSDADGPRFEAKPGATGGAGSAGMGVRAWLLYQSETDEPSLRTERQRVGAPSYFMPFSFA